MSVRGVPWLVPLCLALLLCALPRPARAGDLPAFEIAPGATTISPEEAAIAADPAHGIEGAVVLVDETDLDESPVGSCRVTHHLRAKILSNDARSIADVTIPYDMERGRLKEWWGRVLLPDGKVASLAKEELTRQTVATYAGFSSVVLKGALPGVVPGAVIDLGYVVSVDYFSWSTRVELERNWAVRSFRYRWLPYRNMIASYEVLNAKDKPIDVKASSTGVMITAHDVAPVPSEPLMPPYAQTHAAVLLYYMAPGAERKPKEFWDLEAKRADREIGEFVSKKAVKALVAAMALPDDLPPLEKAKRAYDWLRDNVHGKGIASAEEKDAAVETKKDRRRDRDLAFVLEKKEGTTEEICQAYVAALRQLGLQAFVVYAADRTENFWVPSVMSVGQLDWRLVDVEIDGKSTLVAPGSGLEFGQVPWWLTGVSALVGDPEKARSVGVVPAMPDVNTLETQATLTFSDENDAVLATWTSAGKGQWGYSERRKMRRLGPEERTKRIRELCGGGTQGVEVVESAAPNFEDFKAPFSLACSIERAGTNLNTRTTEYGFAVSGPWFEDLPGLTAPQRTFPVIFDFPRAEHQRLEVAPPHGFAAGTPPAPIVLEGPFGKYTRTVSAAPAGFRVDRTFVLNALVVKPNGYDQLRAWLTDVRRADQAPLPFRRVAAAGAAAGAPTGAGASK